MRKALALFIILILVFPQALATLTVISINSWVLDRDFYEGLVDNEVLYEALLSEGLPTHFNRQTVTETDALPVAVLEAGLREVVTPDYLRDQAVAIVDEVFDVIEGRDNELDLALDLTPIKDALRGEDGPRFAQALADSLPTCDPGQEPMVAGGTLMRCIESNVSVEDAAILITASLPTWINDIPDRLQFTDAPININNDLRGLDVALNLTMRGGLALVIAVLVLITGVFWLLAAFIAGPSARTRLLWLGGSLLVPAILVFGIGLLINGAFAAEWVRFGLEQAQYDGFGYGLALQDAVLNVARTAVGRIAGGFLATGGVAGGISLALIVWGWGMSDKRKRGPDVW